MSKKERQAYRRGIVHTLIFIVEFGFFGYIAVQVLIKICGQ